MRIQHGVVRPAPRILRITRVRGGEQTVHRGPAPDPLLSRGMVAQDSLHEPVHDQPAGGRADQPEPTHPGHPIREHQRITGHRTQQLGQPGRPVGGGEQGLRDRFRAEVGQQPQQSHRARIVQPVHRDGPRCGHRQRIARRLAPGEQLPGPVGQQPFIGASRHASGGQPAPGLCQHQREIPHHRGEPPGLGVSQPGAAAVEQADRVRAGQHIDLHGLCPPRPCRVPGGHQHLPATASHRQHPEQRRRRTGVVDHQQPPTERLAPAEGLHQPADLVLGGVRGRYPHPDGQVNQRGHRQRVGLTGYPPQQVVVGGMPVGVFDGELGFPDPTQAVQRLRQHHR